MRAWFSSLRPVPITIACASNDNYAIGTLVTVRSLLDRLPERTSLRIVILDGGLSPSLREAMKRSWARSGVTTAFIAPDVRRVAHLKLTQGMQAATYLRLLLPDLLPREGRALYLDSDMIVLADIRDVWETDLHGHAFAAVWDSQLSRTLAAIPHYQSLGLNPSTPYCSTGLMLMDLDRWRRERLGERVIDLVARHPECIRWWDQDGMNAAEISWLPLDPTWNVYAEGALLLGWKPTPEERAIAEDLIARQRIIHFVSRYKPWKHACPHPKAPLFYEILDRTALNGWRPDPSTAIPYPPAPVG